MKAGISSILYFLREYFLLIFISAILIATDAIYFAYQKSTVLASIESSLMASAESTKSLLNTGLKITLSDEIVISESWSFLESIDKSFCNGDQPVLPELIADLENTDLTSNI